MLKIKEIIKDGKYLKIKIKRPIFKSLLETLVNIKLIFMDEDNFLEPQLDETGKYIILTFILRNKEDIEPYIKK